MKNQYSFFSVLIWLCFAGQLLGQNTDPQKAVLVDEYSLLTCDGIRYRLDNFLFDLRDSPNSKGSIVIHGTNSSSFGPYEHRRILASQIKDRRFDKNRIEFLRGKDEKEFRVELWKIPSGAALPPIEKEKWDYKLPIDGMKPLLFHQQSVVGEACPETFDYEFFTKFLAANTDLHANLVIYEKSRQSFDRKKIMLSKALLKTHKSIKSQLRYFFVKSKKPDVEFWYVPK